MAPIHTQFDQTLIGLGIYIPSSPSAQPADSSSSAITGLLSSPPAFYTPQSQTRRDAPRSLGTRNGFRSPLGRTLPRSIYAGDENPFLPYPTASDDVKSEMNGEDALEAGGSRSFGELIQSGEIEDLDNLPESHFNEKPRQQLLSPAFVARSRSRRSVPSLPRGNLSGPDPKSSLDAPGPEPSFPSDTILGIPQTPRPPFQPTSDTLSPYTPSTPVPIDYAASPHPTPGASTTAGGQSVGLVASALADDMSAVTNPLFAASIALSIVLGVLIVGLVTCAVAYCRRGRGKSSSDEEKNGGRGGGTGPGSPPRASLAGIYTRGVDEKGTPIASQRSFLKSSDTLTSFSTRSSTLVDSPLSDLASGAGILKATENNGSRVSFAEMIDGGGATGALENRQLYSPPKWQPVHSSPLAMAAPILGDNSDRPSSRPAPANRQTQPDVVAESSSRLSICAVPPLDSIREESVDSHSAGHSVESKPEIISSTTSTRSIHIHEEETESTSYHSCSDNSSMTTHASDDAFGYTSRPTSIADSVFGQSSSSHKIPTVSNPVYTNRSSVASSTPSFDYPLYLIDELDPDDINPELDMSFDTISSLSVSTPRASPSPPPSLDSPIPLQSVLRRSGSTSAMAGSREKRDRRKTMSDWTGGSPSPSTRLRTRFDVADDEESEEDDDEDDETGHVIPTEAFFIDSTMLKSPSAGDIKRSLSLPAKPPAIPTSTSKSVLKRALSALRSGSPTPSSPTSPTTAGPHSPLSELQYGPPTPPRLSRKPTLSRPGSTMSSSSVIIHQSDLDVAQASPAQVSAEDPEGIARFSTASWDQLGQGDGFDAYYLGYGGSGGSASGNNDEGGICAEDAEEDEVDEEGESGEDDDDDMAEINQARISFGFLSSDMGHSDGCAIGMEQLQAFPEPASHLPHIRVTVH